MRKRKGSGKQKKQRPRKAKTLRILIEGLEGSGDLPLPGTIALEVKCNKDRAGFELSQLMIGEWLASREYGIGSDAWRGDRRDTHFTLDLNVFGNLTQGRDGRLILTQTELVPKRRKRNGKSAAKG